MDHTEALAVPKTEERTQPEDEIEQDGTPTLKIVDRVVNEVPIVKSTAELVQSGYERVKNMNRITETACGLAEQTFSVGVAAAKPILSTFERPIKRADSVACDGLDKLENLVPAIQKPPTELYEDVKKYTETVKDTGFQRAEPYLSTADGALNNAINFANSWLPQTENDVPSEGNSLNRFYAFSGKLRTLIEQQATDTAAKIWPSPAP